MEILELMRGRRPSSRPLLDKTRIQWLCILSALLGLLLLCLWPVKSGYAPSSAAQAAILSDGKLIALDGTAQDLKLSQASPKFRLCGPDNSCLSILFDRRQLDSQKIESLALREGDSLRVYGEVSSVQGNKFVRAHIVEIG